MGMSVETKALKRAGIRRALARTRKKLDETVALLPEEGVIPFTYICHFNEVARLMTRMRNLNITLAYLAGITNKTQAVMYQVTEPRISQIVKSVLYK